MLQGSAPHFIQRGMFAQRYACKSQTIRASYALGSRVGLTNPFYNVQNNVRNRNSVFSFSNCIPATDKFKVPSGCKGDQNREKSKKRSETLSEYSNLKQSS